MEPLLLSYEDVQQLLGGISRDVVKSLRKRGHLRAIRIGTRTLFHRESVEEFVARELAKTK